MSVAERLVIDEAGQFSLANAVAVARSAKSLVLFGDPQQLAQPTQAVHPGESGLSALEHLLEGHPTVPEDRGVFSTRPTGCTRRSPHSFPTWRTRGGWSRRRIASGSRSTAGRAGSRSGSWSTRGRRRRHRTRRPPPLLRIVTEAASEDVVRIDVTANCHARGFYRAVGFVTGAPVDTEFESAQRMHLDVAAAMRAHAPADPS